MLATVSSSHYERHSRHWGFVAATAAAAITVSTTVAMCDQTSEKPTKVDYNQVRKDIVHVFLCPNGFNVNDV
jgi:hypothetical protein